MKEFVEGHSDAIQARLNIELVLVLCTLQVHFNYDIRDDMLCYTRCVKKKMMTALSMSWK